MRLVVLIAVSLIAVLLAVPAGGAERPDDRADARGPGAAALVGVVRPDDRPGPRGPGAVEAPVSTERPSSGSGTAAVGLVLVAGSTIVVLAVLALRRLPKRPLARS